MAKLIPAPPAVGPPGTNATAITMIGPSSGVNSMTSTNFNVGVSPVGGLISGTVTVTPSSNGGGGTFTPTSLSLTTGSPTGSFTYTPSIPGNKLISVANNGALTNPSNITYTSVATTVTFTSSQTWTAPSGVTTLISVVGKGQDGTPGTAGTPGTPIARSTIVANVTYFTNSGGDTEGVYYWSASSADASNAVYILNNGGSGTFTTTNVAVYKEGRFDPATYTVNQSYYNFSNAIPNSASWSYASGLQHAGKVVSSDSAIVSWQEYGPAGPGTPATTGANTVGFGITWSGGVGGTAPTATYNNISVTPGASYGVTVPSGGSIIITY